MRFVTQVPRLRVPLAPLAVPGTLDRMGLSQIVNHLLGDGADLQQLEFFLSSSLSQPEAPPAGRFLLRGSLAAYIQSLGLSAETTVTLEYAPALQPPVPGPSFATPDWITALSGSER